MILNFSLDMDLDLHLDLDFKFWIWVWKIIQDIYETVLDFKYMRDW